MLQAQTLQDVLQAGREAGWWLVVARTLPLSEEHSSGSGRQTIPAVSIAAPPFCLILHHTFDSNSQSGPILFAWMWHKGLIHSRIPAPSMHTHGLVALLVVVLAPQAGRDQVTGLDLGSHNTA